MTVYADLTYAVEVGMALIVVGLGLSAIFTTRISQELRNELLLIGAGLLIPLAILHTLFTGLNDWEMGHTDLVGAVVPPLVVAWLSFMFWSTLTPSALMLIGIRLGLVQERIDPTGARRMWDYFLVWNKLLRIYAELNKWAAILVFLGFTVALPIYANIVDSQPTAYILFCFPLFFAILIFSLRTALKHRSQPISVPQRVLWSSLKWRTECKKQGLWNWSRRVEETSWALRELLNASKKHHHKFKMTNGSVMSMQRNSTGRTSSL